MGNEYYRIWNRATLDLDKNDTELSLKWHPVQIDWWEVPGRDEKWYKQQLETFNGNIQRFNQEFGNNFLGSAETLLNADFIKKLKENFAENHLKGKDVTLHKDYPSTTVRMFYPPEQYHAYIIGADPSMGMTADYQAMSIWDITNTFDIKQVAALYDNNIEPKVFAYILAKMGYLYNNAFIAIENNGVSQVVLNALWKDFEYDNIINEGGNEKTSIGIHSMQSRKAEACLNFKLIMEDPNRKIQINDGRLIAEIEKFERISKPGKLPAYEAADGHDDYAVSAIWGFFVLKTEILERYYDIKKSIKNKLGEIVPLFVLPYFEEEFSEEDERKSIFDLDSKLDSYSNEYEKRLNKMKNELDTASIDEFIKKNNLEVVSDDDNSDNDNNIQNVDDSNFQIGFF